MKRNSGLIVAVLFVAIAGMMVFASAKTLLSPTKYIPATGTTIYYDYGTFMPVQIASIVALRNCRDEARKQAAIYQARRDVLCEGLDRIGWHITKPKGAMFVWAPMPEKYAHLSSFDFSLLLLEKANVSAAPGEAFGPGGERFVRMALVENELRLKQAVRQIGRVLNL